MSSLDLRARLKRDLSQSSLNGSSHGSSLRATKRWKSADCASHSCHRKVSFGYLNETVLFDKKDSSSNLSLGVSVSNSSFSSLRSGSSANFRWEAQQPKAGTGNATWNLPPPPPPRDSRWQCSPPPPPTRPSNNMFFKSSATANAFRSLSGKQSLPVTQGNFSFGQHHQSQQAKRPMRCASPTQSMEVERGVKRQSSLMAPPRVPGRCLSPVNTPTTSATQMNDQPSINVQRGVTRESSSSLMAPPRLPGRCKSPVTILPEPIIHNTPTTREFGIPPRRPSRCLSPVTVTPRSSFNLGPMEDPS